MGYRGKLKAQARARELRAEAWTLQEIADELDVAKSSVSVWVRDVEFTPKPRKKPNRNYGARLPGERVHPQRQKKLDQIQRLLDEGRKRMASLSEREFLVAGVALYAGEGSKGDGEAYFANSDPRFIAFYCDWLRHFFEVEESRLRVRLYLHKELNLSAAKEFWSNVTAIPLSQFGKPYRAESDANVRRTKHAYGCPGISYCCSRTHREIMGLVHGLVSVSWEPRELVLPEEFEPMHGV